MRTVYVIIERLNFIYIILYHRNFFLADLPVYMSILAIQEFQSFAVLILLPQSVVSQRPCFGSMPSVTCNGIDVIWLWLCTIRVCLTIVVHTYLDPTTGGSAVEQKRKRRKKGGINNKHRRSISLRDLAPFLTEPFWTRDASI